MLKELAWRGLATADRYLRFSRLVPTETDVVLTYHSVGDPREYGNVSAERFRTDLAYLRANFEVVDLADLVEEAADRRRAAVTFDDGTRSVYADALPLLRAHDVPATVFVVSETFEGDASGLNATRTMSADQVAALLDEPLVTIGNHTRTHPRLSTIDDPAVLEREIEGGKADLEARFGIDVDRFSYPFGDLDRPSVEAVRASHAVAVTTSPGHVSPDTDPVRLPRIETRRSGTMTRWEASGLSVRLRSVLERLGIDDGRVTRLE